MPYIHPDRRPQIDPTYDMGESVLPARGPGELNFQITMLIASYIKHNGQTYQTLNDVSGAMNEAMAEFRRRVIVPYEEGKIKANGDLDVYTP